MRPSHPKHNEASLVSRLTKVKLTHGDIIEVTWWDASGSSSWYSLDNLLQNFDVPHEIKSSGYFLTKSDRHLLITLSISINGNVSEYLVIPWGMIRDIRVVGKKQYAA